MYDADMAVWILGPLSSFLDIETEGDVASQGMWVRKFVETLPLRPQGEGKSWTEEVNLNPVTFGS